jgi:hypothetical protein
MPSPDTTPDEVDLWFAARLAEIMEQAAGRPLTAEERARTHEHTRKVRLELEASMREGIADD